MRQKENSGTHHSVAPQVLSALFLSILTFLLGVIIGVLVALSERNRKKYTYCIFPEVEVLCYFLKLHFILLYRLIFGTYQILNTILYRESSIVVCDWVGLWSHSFQPNPN